ncbi:hypothetical protein [Pseudoalteromonas piscicida]|uniref:hypothetical protein n=1 Tax=Pseudoalteromonas piscicida TaxID=43662 RepID=UPI0030B690D7
MDKVKAFSIVEALANGVDPITGEVMDASSPYNHPDIIRALFLILNTQPKKHIKKTLEQRQTENIAKRLPKNHGLPWSQEAIDQVIALFNSQTAVADIAERFARKPNSIIGLLRKQQVISDEQAYAMGFVFRRRQGSA